MSIDPRAGLNAADVAASRTRFGENRLAAARRKSPLLVFIGQFKDVMTVILMAAVAVSVILGEGPEAIAILCIIFLNALLGFSQEYRTEKALERLKALSAPTSHVVRGGEEQQIASAEIVVGDLVLLRAGDRIPADGVLVDAVAMQSDESLLTGESVPVDKTAADLEAAMRAVAALFGDGHPAVSGEHGSARPHRPAEAERAHMGCVVTRGRGALLVDAVGMATQMGQVAGMLRDIDEGPTPLQKQLAKLGKVIAAGCLIVCAAVAAVGLLRGEPLLAMLLTGVSLAVAAVPEGLPAIVTISLALAVGRIYKRSALVKRLHAVETLGCAGVICSDKTGTLTENRMSVQLFYAGGRLFSLAGQGGPRLAGMAGLENAPAGVHARVPVAAGVSDSNAGARAGTETRVAVRGESSRAAPAHPVPGRPAALREYPAARLACEIAVVCNAGRLRRENGRYTAAGDATESALLVAGARCGVVRDETLRGLATESEQPFDSTRKRMSVVVRDTRGRCLYVKGAPDLLLELCVGFETDSGTAPMDTETRRRLTSVNTALASQALRVIGVAYRPLDAHDNPDEARLVFVGFFGMLDPPRRESAAAVRRCRRAGIRPVMITGDHIETARAIAARVGIWREGDAAYTGAELDRMDDAAFDRAAADGAVFARVSPAHKLRLVRALRRQGQIVAMTGDGVNDAPAVKEADIGVSMGISGTDVTREAADLVLLDDNFATLVAAVEEGRAIYANIRKFIRYLLACNIGEVLTMLFGMLLGLPVVLLPIQILLINLVTDGLPAIALGLDPADPEAMARPPRTPGESVFAGGLGRLIVFRGILIGATTLAVFLLLASAGLDVARTGAFLALVFAQLIHVFECKSETRSLFTVPVLNNKKLLAAAASSFAIVMAAVYVPALQPIFSTVPLSGEQLGLVALCCLCAPVIDTLRVLLTRVRRR